MSESYDLGPVERVTAGAVGEPGERVFYVQARARGEQLTITTEKEQVRVLAEALGQLLESLPDGDEGAPPPDGDLELTSPLEPAWRAGEMSIEFDESVNRIAITLLEQQIEDPDEERVEPQSRARFEATRAQVRAMAAHALEVVAAGRPRCQLCGYPMEAGGVHMCPAMNGHRSYRE